MNTTLYRFKKVFEKGNINELKDYYVKDNNDIQEHLESTGEEADLNELETILDDYVKESIKNKWYNNAQERAKKDGQHSVAVHKALKHIPRQLACDTSFWQWLSLVKFRRYTIFRWCDIKNQIKLASKADSHRDLELIEQDSNIPSSFLGRLIGGSSMKHTTSLHSISRLFWSSEYLYSETDGYSLAEDAYSPQDLAQALLQRRYTQHYIIARTFATKLKREKNSLPKDLKKPIQSAARKLSLAFATINSDYLDKKDIEDLINFN